MTIPNYVEWSDRLSVGIQEIDEQHKYLVGLVNQLNVDLLTSDHGSESANETLDKLIDYTRTHFVVEESLMRILGYPDYESHKQHHEELLRRVLDFKHQMVDRGRVSRSELMEFLEKWLTGHIMNEDVLYSEHFLSRGAQRRWATRRWLKKFW